MASGPGQAVLDWVAGVLGNGPPEVVCGLRDGASPWLLRAGGREVVLRVGRPGRACRDRRFVCSFGGHGPRNCRQIRGRASQ
jgi:hypothetical protein